LDLKSATASAAATLLLAAPASYSAYGGTVNTAPIETATSELFDFWVQVPATASRPAPRVQSMTVAIRKFTGWSQRKLAVVLNTSHPTVAALEQGRSTARVGDMFERIVEVHGVVERLFLLANQEAAEVDRLLEAAYETGPPAIELLGDRRPAEAYLAALDVSRPRRVGQMMKGVWPASAGQATVDLAASEA
jgi:transcriptional regulator with XRE-family HTH domain